MARNFRPVVRDQVFLLPPDMADWLPEDHLVWFVLEVVKNVDVTAFESKSRLGGVGRAPFDPRMMLALLLYGYSTGQRSSRQLERLCGQDVAFRVITGNQTVDHATISRFRVTHENAMKDVFVGVLAMCAAEGMVRLGVVAIDGTKIDANASLSSNMTEERLLKEVETMLGEAAAADAEEDEKYADARGDELPEKWRSGNDRAANVKEALRQAQEQRAKDSRLAQAREEKAAKAEAGAAEAAANPQMAARSGRPPLGCDRVEMARLRFERERARDSKRIDEWNARQAAGKTIRGRAPLPVDEGTRVRRAKQRWDAEIAKAAERATEPQQPPEPSTVKRSTTDPESRIMKGRYRWQQACNGQLAVTDDQIIIAASMTQDRNDIHRLVPMMEAAVGNAKLVAANRPKPAGTDAGCRGEPRAPDVIGVIVADAGYLSEDNIAADGPERLIALGKEHTTAQAARTDRAQGPAPGAAAPFEAMSHKLRTEKGAAAYARRKVLVEPVNGHLKDRIGLRRLSRRGLTAANAELQFAAAAANMLKIFRHRAAIREAAAPSAA